MIRPRRLAIAQGDPKDSQLSSGFMFVSVCYFFELDYSVQLC